MGEETNRGRALEALSLMRRKGLSLTAAAKEADITPRQVHRWAGRALTKRGRRWMAKPWDRLSRRLRFIDARGLMEVEARDSRTATRIARYNAAVHRFLTTGDERALREFNRKSFSSRGVVHYFLTDSDVLQTLALVDEIAFEDMYASAA
jgi:hypothetical protein